MSSELANTDLTHLEPATALCGTMYSPDVYHSILPAIGRGPDEGGLNPPYYYANAWRHLPQDIRDQLGLPKFSSQPAEVLEHTARYQLLCLAVANGMATPNPASPRDELLYRHGMHRCAKRLRTVMISGSVQLAHFGPKATYLAMATTTWAMLLAGNAVGMQMLKQANHGVVPSLVFVLGLKPKHLWAMAAQVQHWCSWATNEWIWPKGPTELELARAVSLFMHRTLLCGLKRH